MPRPLLLPLTLGLLLSGLAGIINQVVWQRALKVYLGGSETLSAMIVVIVFLGGLGLGSALTARRVGGLRSPLLALALVELGLALVNLLVAGLLSLDLSESVYAAQRFAQGLGLPIRLVYGLAAALLLLPPTALMGATMPLSGAACQRQLGAREGALVPLLFVLNTLGAAAGAWSATALLLPHWGQRAALFAAVLFNLLAGLCFFALGPRREASPAPPVVMVKGGLRPEEWVGGALGLLSLSFEMLLIRSLSLAHEPVPATFATALCAFLLLWSAGVALAGRLHLATPLVAGGVAVMLSFYPALWQSLRDSAALPLPATAAVLGLPCLGFGLLYGQLAAGLARDWGRDLGRYSAINTLGSCLGVLGFTLLGFEAPLAQGASALAVGMVGVAVALAGLPRPGLSLGALGAVVLAWGIRVEHTEHQGELAWWGRDGVVELTPDGAVYIDGLWHTRLSDGQDHIGEPYAWLMAAGAVLGRGEAPLQRALVIGAGVGISGVTLAGVEGLKVDGYEINHTLRRLLEARPTQTLSSLAHPGLRWIWTDARTGLALDEQRYDLILSAPLHLRAAGSSHLLSTEYLRLVKSRLEPGGVLVVYANEGVPAQALLVQRTLAEHFAHRATWMEGLVTVASDRPFELDAEWLAARMARSDRFASELRHFDQQLRLQGEEGMISLYDGEALSGEVADRPITDDHPLLEYPELAEEVVGVVPWPPEGR